MDDGEVARLNKVDYNSPPPCEHAEGHHCLPFPCVSEEYSPLKENVVLPLQGVLRIARLPRRGASRGQACNNSEPYVSSWVNQLVVLVVFSLVLASCTPYAQLVDETATGGTVVYSYVEEQDVLSSPERQDALRLLGEKCPTGYRISREGEVPRVDQAVDRAWMGQLSRDGQVSRERRWAIQFSCK